MAELQTPLQTPNSGGIGFIGLLTILFIGLKLSDLIDWSWVWVLAPIWISIATVLTVVGVLLITGVGIYKK